MKNNPKLLQYAYTILKPIIFRLDAEWMHEQALEQIKNIKYYASNKYELLKVELFGYKFNSPLLLAAGFDKNGILVDHVQSLGFGGEVVGSVTAKRWIGNDKPRLFRLSKVKGLLNRMGLNNDGAEIIGSRLEGKNNYALSIAQTPFQDMEVDDAIDDILYSYRLLKNLGIYTEINLSCPNTKDGKTFEDPEHLELLLNAILAEGKGRPLLIKISPNLENEVLKGIVSVADNKVDGYVATNTKLCTDNILGKGGLSGKPLQKDSLNTIIRLRQLTNKTIIGVGGIFSGPDAFEMLFAGANLLQAYTGFVYRGPTFAMKVAHELDDIMRKTGICHISDIKLKIK